MRRAGPAGAGAVGRAYRDGVEHRALLVVDEEACAVAEAGKARADVDEPRGLNAFRLGLL